MAALASEGSCDPRLHAAERPDAVAFTMSATGESVTFAVLEARANQGAQLLRQAGIGPGEHIAILMENRREFLEICFAADRAGIYYTTISTHLAAPEIAYILADCGARLLIVSERFSDQVAAIAGGLDGSCAIYALGGAIPGCLLWEEAVGRCPATPISDEAQGLDMLYSSGTTGRPKGVKWALTGEKPGRRSMLVDLLSGLFGYSAETRYLCPAPLYHAAPLRHTMVTIRMGGTAVVMEKFDALEALVLLERHRITHSQWVPTMFVRMLKLPEAERRRFDLSAMRMAVHAAAPCPIEVKRAMIDWWGPILHEYYAGTENNGFVALDTPEWLAHPGSVGRARLGIIHVCDPGGEELPLGEEGEIYFENGHQFEYHNAPEKTAAARNARGWTTLGDIGRLDADGYLYLTDRKSFVIITGGVNVYPQETENVLVSHPAVLDAAVFGLPHPDFGEEVKGVVQLVDPAAASPALAEGLIGFCRERLSTIKCPRSIDFREHLPREANGKLFKRRLRDEYLETIGRAE